MSDDIVKYILDQFNELYLLEQERKQDKPNAS